ncbi:ferric reductase-like transmembrane domain-containing protein [Granulosicoccus antarcticus]|uniref:FAD-binding FR-type domain-containing protein n=1 Tax=Granulosicoccus antarcticus IMCC3135 TaxID=1192854 RepID=A0A2Z2NLD6_9GAMM|nr:ferric reductase-like transmembrane domain-containing protein [Granulosicoccus antarcticus]ASJ72262.1 hypothetical protein IMCC3135_10850 [Granulosicoccus antarcticus IMCC3135]
MSQKKSLHWGVLLGIYCLIALAPLAMSIAVGIPPPLSGLEEALHYPPRAWYENLASGLALVALPMLLMEFATSGRVQFLTGRVSYQRVIRLHRITGIVLGVFALVHPFIYYIPRSVKPVYRPEDLSHLALEGSSGLTGYLAWGLLVILIAFALGRRSINYRYETWRITHVVLSVAVSGLVLHHALVGGFYSQSRDLSIVWLVLTCLAGLLLVYVFLWLPLKMSQRPFRLMDRSEQGRGRWLLTFEPEGFDPKPFQKGQMVWISFNSPFSVLEHPFTIDSDPGQGPGIQFSILETGDWTKHIGDLPLGSHVYLNGPCG